MQASREPVTASMRAEPGMRHRHGMHLAPAIVEFAAMLSLNSQELEDLVRREVEQNPALERVDEPPCPVCGGLGMSARCPLCNAAWGFGRGIGRSDCVGWGNGVSAPCDDAARDIRAALSYEDFWIGEYFLGCIDEHGFLDVPVEEIAATLRVNVERVTRVLATMRELFGPDFAASDPRECLLLQLTALENSGEDVDLIRRIVSEHLPDLAARRLKSVAARLGTGIAEVERAKKAIRDWLRPFPAFDLYGPPLRDCVVPDLVFLTDPDLTDRPIVRVVERTRLGVTVNLMYESPPAQLELAELELLTRQAERARRFVNRLNERWETLAAVGVVVARHQAGFLRGESPLRPLSQKMVAEMIHLHDSTVSRAIAGKYVMLPTGKVVTLKSLFCSGASAKEELRRLVDTEISPLSDAELAKRLGSAGHRIARRTVTKYREQLRILPSFQRG